MDEKDANIDLVFRNGFRNLEVLPPPEVWDNINPVKLRRQRNAVLFRRVAASVAVIVSAGVLLYQWNGKMPGDSLSQVVDPESVPLVEIFPERNLTEFKVIPDKINSDALAVISDTVNRKEFPISKVDFLPAETDFGNNDINTLLKTSDNVKSIFVRPVLLPDDPYMNLATEEKQVKMADRWAVAAMAAPTYFSQLNFGKDEFARQITSSEQPVMSYSGGVALSYKINKRVSVQSGLFYSSVGQQINGISSFGGFRKYDNTKGARNFEVQTSSGVVYTSNADVFLVDEASSRVMTQFTSDIFDPQKANLQYINNSLRQNYSYLELPVFIRYKVIDRTLDVNLIGGLSYNFLVNNSVYAVNQGSHYTIGKTEGLSIMAFSSSLGMGMEYSLTRNISLNLEPTFRYYLNPFRAIEVSDIHPYSFGVYSGISFRF